jgi:hypothetical protein
VNSALRFFECRDQFAWHLSIIIECKELGSSGMPTAEENQVLYALEDEIGKNLLLNDNAVFLARVTCCGQRELSYRVRAPKDANQWLALLVAQPNPREWQYQMEHDPDWGLATPFMRLFEHIAN